MARKSKKLKAAVAVAMPNPEAGAKPSRAILALERAARAVVAKTNGSGAPAPPPAQVRVSVDVLEGTPAYYANYIEIGQTKWDFTLIASRLPVKPSSAKIVEVQNTGVLTIPADVTINFPAHLMPGLIRALTMQKETFEKQTKIELKEVTDERNVQNKRGKHRGR